MPESMKPIEARSKIRPRLSSLDRSLALLGQEANEIIKRLDLREEGIIAKSTASCFEVGLFLGEAGEARWIVKVDEADPTNPQLQALIEDSLAQRGWGMVEVVCEW